MSILQIQRPINLALKLLLTLSFLVLAMGFNLVAQANSNPVAVDDSYGGYNLLGYTEDLTHSSWLKENYGSSGQIPVITPNAVANPLTGEQNATRIDFDAVN